MKILLILALLISHSVIAREVNYSWPPVTQATDGDTIIVDAYNLYCSFGDVNVIDNKYKNILPPGDYDCKFSAVYKGIESELTKSYLFTIPALIPQMPGDMTIDVTFKFNLTSQ